MKIPIIGLLIILVPLFLVPGTILGWVAAGRILQSEGRLYGLRLAASAALALPAVIALTVPLIASALVIRIGSFTSLGNDSAMWLGIALAVSLLLLSFRLLHGCYRKLVGKGTIGESFQFRTMRATLIVLAIVWCVAVTLAILNRPEVVVSAAPGSESRMMNAEAEEAEVTGH